MNRYTLNQVWIKVGVVKYDEEWEGNRDVRTMGFVETQGNCMGRMCRVPKRDKNNWLRKREQEVNRS